ncbi:hypothetical protein QFC19_008878 [Naganishia cerealis]|uniref:Uncharacterized protein n=1 Tax=Naganishia cerealis TaxID=610337 RepID=A0ACC2UYX8_9TREE|nr:hypothetical protein QFC19_008878 [Naganishia cerealis]
MFTPHQINSSTPRTQKRSRHGGRLSQLLRVSHQQVKLDVDIERKSVSGVTDIAIVPSSNSLRTIKLDCREMKISSITVNKRKVNYIHQDLLYINNPEEFESKVNSSSIDLFDLYSNELTIHQHHLIRQKLNYLFGDVNFDPREPSTEVQNGNTEELKILLPENFKFEQTDRYNSPEVHHHDSGTPMHLRKSTFSSDYSPIMVRIKYTLKNPQNGLKFVSGDHLDVKKWHVYTTNSEFNISTSSWVPCIDNLWDKCSWTIELDIPRSTKEFENRTLESNNHEANGDDDNAMNKDEEENEKEQEDGDDENSNEENENMHDINNNLDDDEYLDMVVCAGDIDNYKELPHPSKRDRKLVSWSIFNPISAHHVGWCLGPFQSYTVSSDSNDVVLDDDFGAAGAEVERDSTNAPLTIYALQDDLEDAKNTSAIISGALDFFLREFGTFPFTSYAVTFVHDLPIEVNNFAGLSVISDTMLFPADIIEPMFTNTEILIDTLAEQWSGINITPQQFGDFWVTIGISKFMSLSYIRHLMGQNEYRFRIKIKKAQVADEDVGKKPLAYQFYQYPLSTSDLSFVSLKAPVVLYILDKRMTKTDKSFGLSRVLPKIFLQAMSGDLQNSTLSTLHFQYVCEKVNRNKLESFFKQWVFNAGVPLFLVAQRFNKKRSIIEMQIRQIQLQIIRKSKPNSNNFMEDSIAYLDDEPSFLVQPVFTGPMTIRIHEANGTPYEHIIDLKHETSKLDIQYNTKFRRMKKKTGDEVHETVSSFKQLGDILQTKAEMEEWNLVEWIKDEEDPLFNDAFEWLRVDADFEWISKMSVKQPDYMFASQLQYDRDVEAQYEAVRYFATRDKPNRNYCTVLTRTVMDSRYYYGVRIAAARALAGFSKTNNLFIGLEYLMKIFKTLYCFPESNVPKTNDFNDLASYFLKKEMISIFATIRDDDGNSPTEVKRFLLSLLKYNDNSNNDYQDGFYVAALIKALTSCIIITGDLRDIPDVFDNSKQKFVDDALVEINRLHKLDEWVPSYHNMISVVCLQLKVQLAVHGYYELPFEDLLPYTLGKFPLDVRVEAFRGLFLLGGLRNAAVMKYFLTTCLLTRENSRFKRGLVEALCSAVASVATGPAPSTLDDPEFNFYQALEGERLKIGTNKTNMMIIDDGMDLASSRKEMFAKSSIEGAIDLLRAKFAQGEGLKNTLWELLHNSLLSLYERRRIFNLCQILYEEKDQFLVRLPVHNVPLEDFNKKIVAKYIGDNTVVIKREGRFKIQLARLISVEHSDKKKRRHSAVENDDELEDNKSREKRPILRFTTKPKPEEVPTPVQVEEVVPELQRIGLVAVEGTLVNIKLSSRTLRSLAKVRSAPAPVANTPSVVSTYHPVTLKFEREVSRRIIHHFVNGASNKRYVKIFTKEGRAEVSSKPYTKSTGGKATESQDEKHEISVSETTVNEEAGTEQEREEPSTKTPDDGKVEKPDNQDQKSDEEKGQNLDEGETQKSNELKAQKPDEQTNEADEVKGPKPEEHAVTEPDRSEKPALESKPLSRSVSPFDTGPAQTKGYRKKKKEVYIHNGSPSPATNSDENNSKSGSDKVEETKSSGTENGEKLAPKPKLKLKLSLKK